MDEKVKWVQCVTALKTQPQEKKFTFHSQNTALHRNSILNDKNFKDTDFLYGKPEFRISEEPHGSCVVSISKYSWKLAKMNICLSIFFKKLQNTKSKIPLFP